MDVESAGKKVFFSYAREDGDFTQKLAASLEDLGHTAWVDTSKLLGGDDYRDVIAREIPGSDVFIPVISNHSIESEWVEMEIDCAFRQKVPIIPVIKEAAIVPERLNLLLARFNQIDFTEFNTGQDPWAALAGAVAGKPAREFLPDDGLPQDLREVIRKWSVARDRYMTVENNLRILNPWVAETGVADRIADREGVAMMLVASLHVGNNWKYWTDRNAQESAAGAELLANLNGRIGHVRPRLRALYALQFIDQAALEEAMESLEPPLAPRVEELIKEYVLSGRVKIYLEKLRDGNDRKMADYAEKILNEIARFFGDGPTEDRDSGLPFI